jgi:hypothetical protein
MCDANDRICTQKEQVLAARPGVSGHMSGVSGPAAQNTKNSKHHISYKSHTNKKVLKDFK